MEQLHNKRTIMEIVEKILGGTWLIVCITILGFGISSYLQLKMGNSNKIMDNIKKMERDEKKRKS